MIFVLLLTILASVVLGQSDLHEYGLAGFFHEDNSQAKLAFDSAINTFNMFHLNTQFINHTEIVPVGDTFFANKLLCKLMERSRLAGVVCPNSAKVASIMESIGNNLELPVIQTNWRPSASYSENDLVVNFFPYPKLLFQGLGVIVKHLQWRSIVIFYEDTENLIALQGILKVQNLDGNRYNTIMLKKLGPGPDYRSALKEIQNKSEHRIILDCKTEHILDILWQAKELKLLEPHFNYFLTSLDAHTVDLSKLNTLANITTVRIVNPNSANFQDVVQRWKLYADAYGRKDVIQDVYSVKTETALMHDAISVLTKTINDLNVRVPIQTEELNCYDVKKWDFGFQIRSFMLLHEFTGNDSTESITSPLKFDKTGKRVGFHIYVVGGNRDNLLGTWSPERPDFLQYDKSEADRTKELEMTWRLGDVVVASIIGPPYLMKKIPKDDTILENNDRYEGFSMDLMNELAKELKVKFRFEVLATGARGVYDKQTKSWNGLIREVLDRRAELAICDLTITPERREVVDFSTPFMRLGISILYKKADAKDADMYAFLKPFFLDLWIYSATIYLGITVVLFLITRLSPADWENPHPCDQEPEELENIWGMKNCLWLTLGAIMNQGCDILPKGLSPRLAASCWWFFAIIVTNSYMANLAAFLTNERSQGSIKSAEDLAMQNKVKYGTLHGGSTEAFFRDSNYSLYQRMWTSMQQSKPSVFENSNDDGVARVQNTKNRMYAFLMESSTLEYQIQTKCDLMQVGTWLDSKGYGIAMPLDYPHRSAINEALLTLQEEGRIDKLKKKWWQTKRVENGEKLCPVKDSEQDSSGQLALRHVGGVFLVLGVGIGLAYMVAIAEFLWNVRNISVEEHMSFKQALKVEVLFALNICVTKKRTKPQLSESSSSHSSAGSREGSRSLGRSVLQGAGSFLRLDSILSKTGTASSRHASRPLDD